jgi:hypothetical protein
MQNRKKGDEKKTKSPKDAVEVSFSKKTIKKIAV